MGGVEDINASRLEEAVDHLEMRTDIFRVEVFEELVAEGEVATGVGEIEVVAVVNDELKIVGEDLVRRTLVGDIDAVDFPAILGGGTAEAAIPGGELDEDGPGSRPGKMGVEEAQLRFEIVPGGLGGFATGETWMIGDPFEEFGVERLEEFGALFPGRGLHPGGQFALHLVVVSNSLRCAGL